MSFIDIAAVVGALAWIPPIFVAVRGWLKKARIRVITQPTPEVGYTALGPILNLRVAITVEHKDIVITGVRLLVTHESGDSTTFSWRGIVQRMGTLTYPQVGAVPFEKELNVLAMKVSQKDVEERFIRFQDIRYLARKVELEDASLKRMAYLRSAGSFEASSFLKSQEMTEVYAFIRQAFAWKPGAYRVRVELDSPDSFIVTGDEYCFALSPLQVQRLSANLQYVETFYANEVNPLPPPPEKIEPIPWGWVYPDMQSVAP